MRLGCQNSSRGVVEGRSPRQFEERGAGETDWREERKEEEGFLIDLPYLCARRHGGFTVDFCIAWCFGRIGYWKPPLW